MAWLRLAWLDCDANVSHKQQQGSKQLSGYEDYDVLQREQRLPAAD